MFKPTHRVLCKTSSTSNKFKSPISFYYLIPLFLYISFKIDTIDIKPETQHKAKKHHKNSQVKMDKYLRVCLTEPAQRNTVSQHVCRVLLYY